MFQKFIDWIKSFFKKEDAPSLPPPPPAKPQPPPVVEKPPVVLDPGPVKGIDISHWQGNIDIQKLKDQGNAFLIAKATDGTSYVDPKYSRNKEEAKKAGLIFGSYHWLKISQDIDAQVEHFVKVTGKKQPGELPPVIDWEPDKDTKSVGVAQTKARLLEFLQKLEAIHGVAPIIYASPGFLDAYGDLSAFSRFPLWIAHYGVGHPRIPRAWPTYTIWQYTDKNGLDLNLFNGSMDRLKKLSS
jgi:lysozyme